ncbi:MAG TPA: PD-(D/E)XK nuclease family protein [Solirubrobacterales bacterium]|nr:PD-(D/E)XK nuclease family protein [Solirubrobacterales bacterium]
MQRSTAEKGPRVSMSLTVIAGPPGSGRGEEVLDGFRAAIDLEPVLVVPTSDDVDRLERELCAGAGGILGGTVTSFPGLFREVGRSVGVDAIDGLSSTQRAWLARAAASAAPLRRLSRSARHAGFAPAFEDLLTDLQSSGLDAAAFTAAVAAAEAGEYEREIAALFESYESLRDERGLSDDHQLAARTTAALRGDPGAWSGRPVFLYGYDDLTREQVELVGALAAACEVTVTVTFEDRRALAARAQLLGILREELGAEVVERARPAGGDRPATLAHLERSLFEPGADGVPADGSLRLLEGAGERGEAELIGRRIARLLADGADPDSIAIAVRSPDRQAPAIAKTLARLGIPLAPEAGVPLAMTATGSTLLELLAIVGGDAAASTVVSLLRRPARARPEQVDWLERAVLRGRMRTAEEALAEWSGDGEEPRSVWALDALREAGDDPMALANALTRIAADVAERPHSRSGLVPSGGPALELRASTEAARTLDEVVALGDLAPRDPASLAELLAHVRVPLWRGPTEGRVRILSPYRLRATRVAHLFVAGLADGSFPAASAADPLLSDERRRALGLPARSDPADEERYLFHACVSKPERCLHLSYPASDEAGATAPRSAFVDEVRDLLSPPPTPDPADDPLEPELVERATLADFVAAPEDASAFGDLARALAAAGGDVEARAAELTLPEGTAERAVEAVIAARRRVRAARAPGPISHPDILAELGAQDLFGASTLEGYHLCSYRWFVDHELNPRRIGPDPEPLENGGIIHEALERLFRDPPNGHARPTPETVDRWIERAREVVREVASERGWDPEGATATIALTRFDAVLARYLRRDAETGGPLMPEPELLELAFGDGPEDSFPPADLGAFRLRGKIDRIDVKDRFALIRDYKLSASAPAGAKLVEEGKLQLPLYMLAARGFGLEPIGGLYSPLAASTKDRPRGLLDKSHKAGLIPGETACHYGTDFKDPEVLAEIVDDALAEATRVVTEIRAGRIGRNPRGGTCPTWCGMAPICRIERGVPMPDDDDDEDEDEI